DEPKIYNYTRTQQQIQQDYIRGIQSMQTQQANLSNGLVGHWKMDETNWSGTAGEVKDSSGNGSHSLTSSGASVTAGKYGNAGNYDGSECYIRTASPAVGTTHNTLTLSTWFKHGPQTGYILGPHANEFDNYITYDSEYRRIGVRIS